MSKWITDRNPEKPGEYLTVLNDIKVRSGYLFFSNSLWDGQMWLGLGDRYQIHGWMEVEPMPTKPMQKDGE